MRIAAAVIAALLASPSLAHADGGKISELTQQAETDFKGGDFESAKFGLLEAIAAGKSGGDQDAVARAYVALGAVYLGGYKDKAKATKFMTAAVKLRPDVKLPKGVSSPAAEELLASLRESKGPVAPAAAPAAAAVAVAAKALPAAAPSSSPAKAADPKPAEAKPVAAKPADAKLAEGKPAAAKAVEAKPPEAKPGETKTEAKPVAKKTDAAGDSDELDLPANYSGPLHCPAPDEAPPGEAIELRCAVKPGVSAARVTLFFRMPGQEEFTSKRAKRSGKGWYLSTIPADAAAGRAVQYYFEARDASGETVASFGRGESPNLILLREGAASVSHESLFSSGSRRSADDDGSAAKAEDDPLLAIARENAARAEKRGLHRRGPNSLFVGVSGGGSRGWHPATKMERRSELNVGAGPASAGLFTVLPEIGFQFAELWAVSLQVRYANIPTKGSDDNEPGAPATSSLAALARIQRYFGSGNAQFVLSAALGGGAARLYVAPQPDKDLGAKIPRLTQNDTVKAGALLLGPGVGFIYHVNEHVSIVAEGRGLAGVPDFAAVVDLSAGFQLAF